MPDSLIWSSRRPLVSSASCRLSSFMVTACSLRFSRPRPRAARRRSSSRPSVRTCPRCHAAATRTASAEPATSCTRTHQAPAAAASADTAAVARSRASGGAGSPSGPASRCPRNRLRLAPTSTGKPSATSSGSRASSGQLLLPAFAKPSPGSSTTCSSRTPAARSAATRAGELAPHVGHHVVVVVEVVHHVGVPAPVHRDVDRARPRHDVDHLVVGQPARHVVDDRGPTLDGRPRDHRAGRVDAHGRTAGHQLLDHRQHPRQLVVDRHPPGAGPGRLTADVQQVRPLVEQLQAVRDRRAGREPAAAVREGVRGDVDDAHDEGAVAAGAAARAGVPGGRRGQSRCRA